jgi:phytoene synthase
MSEIYSLATPEPASSLYFAIRKAPLRSRVALRALYTLHKKWREAAVYTDQHHAVTTLNWWHHELEKVKIGEINHPALIALKPWLNDEAFFNALQSLLHGHMHWHHLTRLDTVEQLQPTIDAIAQSFVQVWLSIVGQTELNAYAQAAGLTLWWIDQNRHIGHSLTPSRLWLPMIWLKELNLPAHLLLNRKLSPTERAQHGNQLMRQLIKTAQHSLAEYHEAYATLSTPSCKAARSMHALVEQRALLLDEIEQQPQDVWSGLVSVTPRRKWWCSLWV